MAEYESPVDNGIPLGDTSDTAREFNSSDRARARPLESQFGELGIKDLSNFWEKYCEMEKQVDSLQAENDKLTTENDKLNTDNINLQAENMRLYLDDMKCSFKNLERKLQSDKVRANDNEDGNNSAEDDENSNQVSSSCRTLNYVRVPFKPALC